MYTQQRVIMYINMYIDIRMIFMHVCVRAMHVCVRAMQASVEGKYDYAIVRPGRLVGGPYTGKKE